jgi:predicted site-specific integrase-resolvase
MPVDPNQINPKLMYSVQESALIIEKKEQTVRSYINSGRLKAIKGDDNRWRIKGSELIRFLNGSNSTS